MSESSDTVHAMIDEAPESADSGTPADGSPHPEPSAPGAPLAPGPTRGEQRSHLTPILIGAIVVLAVALAAALGFILGRGTDGPAGRSQVAVPFPAKQVSLREAVEAAVAEGYRLESQGANSVATKAFVERWVVPSCAAFINGMAEAFGGADESAPSSGRTSVVSVRENGDNGTVVTETDGERETQQWVRTERGWQMTCADMFDDDAVEAEDPAPVDTPPATRPPAATAEPNAGTGPTSGTAEPHVVECLPGTPGPARWSDGTVAFSQSCFDANGGEAYMSAERRSGRH